MNTTKEPFCKIEIEFFQNTEDRCVERVLRFDGKEMLRDSTPSMRYYYLEDEISKLHERFDPESELFRSKKNRPTKDVGFNVISISEKIAALQAQLKMME
jgi:hypothetical protein